MTDVPVRTATHGAVLRVVLDDEATLNALTAEGVEAVNAAVTQASQDAAVRVVLLTGAGRAFSSGANLTGGLPAAPLLEALTRLVRTVQSCPTPVVAAVNGVAAGAAVSLALAADLVVARRSASFALAFVKIGLMPDAGATALIPAAVGRARAMRLALLGERLTAQQAYEQGLIAWLAEDDEFDGVVESLVHDLAAGPAAAHRQIKAAVNAACLPELERALAREADGQRALAQTEDLREGVAAFAAKRPPRFVGR
ncbi:enoyl-CoA hydratase-related protein [Xylanimonas ulmi]|uniref:Enoyl-CoA hydratase n=1 Tax=Xylanimonas ulmi TaxID=228973 RepID=A0A4Q7M672_9MICO|nr:enoyl-CoA hydratase-related protein [Xylanibacterium ulmi]RZS61549.1 enoyl-CoA hydratase [Xylanibacterium ulmi]